MGPVRIGVIGAGPAGLFLSSRLLKYRPDVILNIFDYRTSPFGLLKYGVAPDHPEVKNIINTFKDVLAQDNVSVYCGVKIGESIRVEDLEESHDAVVVCTGMQQPKLLNIPGESLLKNSITATEFVGWYNGDPLCQKEVDLESVRDVAIIGHGNVALDVARILLKPWEAFSNTDIDPRALSMLKRSPVSSVDIYGRRGPLQVSFTTAELREIFSIPNCSFTTDSDVVQSQLSKHEEIWKNDRPYCRLMELIKKHSIHKGGMSLSNGASVKRWSLKYFQAPTEILGQTKVEGLVLEHTSPSSDVFHNSSELKRAPVKKTGIKNTVKYDMVVSCIGFRSSPTFGLPCNENGVIKNVSGRVLNRPNLYVAGWAGYGSEGEITTTMHSAREVAGLVLHDLEKQGTESVDKKASFDSLVKRSGIQKCIDFKL